MASLEHQTSGNYTVRFYFGKRKYNRSLNTTDEGIAWAAKVKVEETIRLLKRGVLKLPPDANYEDAGEFIVSGGERVSKPTNLRTAVTLSEVKTAYFDAIPDGGKAASSLGTEKTHAGHLIRLLKGSTLIETIREPELQTRYINKRAKEKGHNGKSIQPDTIKKELQTFFQMRDLARANGWVRDDLQRKRLVYPKAADKPPFKTWSEIEAAVNRGGLDDRQIEELWDCLFLNEEQVVELIEFVAKNAEHDFILPLFAIPAFTGARRSEAVRAQVDDFSLNGGPCFIREKKRKHDRSLSFRQVPMLPPLKEALEVWLKKHPGSSHLICTPPNFLKSRTKSEAPEPLTKDQATDFFQRTLANSKWKVIKGFHTLRHSFASICAMKGLPQSIIDSWMGHQTEEMRARYRHLFPEETNEAMGKVFTSTGLFARGR